MITKYFKHNQLICHYIYLSKSFPEKEVSAGLLEHYPHLIIQKVSSYVCFRFPSSLCILVYLQIRVRKPVAFISQDQVWNEKFLVLPGNLPGI